MLHASDIPPEHWQETGVFSICETLSELFVAVHRLLGLPAVEQLLIDDGDENTRESLRRAADELKLVGLTDLATSVRRYTRRAKPEPRRVGPGYQTNSALIAIAQRRAEAGQVH